MSDEAEKESSQGSSLPVPVSSQFHFAFQLHCTRCQDPIAYIPPNEARVASYDKVYTRWAREVIASGTAQDSTCHSSCDVLFIFTTF